MLRLIVGASALPERVIRRHVQFVLDRQQADGGWAGREGATDPYYTSFALRILAMAGQLHGEVAERSARFLAQRTQGHETVVDLLSLIYSAKLIEASCGLDPLAHLPEGWQSRVAGLLEQLRCADGGYGKTIDAMVGSTYQTFLSVLCYELLELPIPDRQSIVRFLLEQRQVDGGFLEIRVAKRSGANPTAAAVATLQTLQQLPESMAEAAGEFLGTLQTDEGGFTANTRIPVPDVLSTFTSALTLADLGYLDRADGPSVERYVLSMERPTGGFAGFEYDPSEDVEYTFYGLGTLAVLRSVAAAPPGASVGLATDQESH